jgi:hypothetical protein
MRLQRAAIVAFGLVLLGFEGVSRAVIADLSYRGGPLPLYELAQALAHWPVRPTAVFLGASHTQCAVVPSTMETELGLARGAVVSGGRNNGGLRESAFVYGKAREGLRGSRFVVIDVGDRDFNMNLAVWEMKGPDPWRRRAGLVDRLAAPGDIETKWDWTLGWAWKTWDLRASWRDVVGIGWTEAAQRLGLASAPTLFEEDGRAHVPEERAEMTAQRLAADAEKACARHFQRYELDEEALAVLAGLVERIRNDGPKVLLIEYPVSPAYRDVVARRYSREDRLWREALAARLPEIRLLALDDLAEDFAPRDFRDSDHLSRSGAERFSKRFATRLSAAPGKD